MAKINFRIFVVLFVLRFFNSIAYAADLSMANINNGLKFKKLFEKHFESETMMSVRAFDLKHNNSKNGIAVCGKKLYIFSPHGTLLSQSYLDVFQHGAWQMRIAKFSKDGYSDNIIVSDGESKIIIFDSLGIEMAEIKNGSKNFYAKDLNDDGSEEIIMETGQALYTKYNGMTWGLLWDNQELRYNMDDIKDWGSMGGICTNKYCSNIVFAIDKNGEILFKTELLGGPMGSGEEKFDCARCLVAGDFDGNGIKDEIAIPAVSGFTAIIDRNGSIIRYIRMKIDGEVVDLNETTEIAAGQLIQDSDTDEFVVTGRRGLVACDAQGNILWSYIKWEGGNRNPCIDNLYICDLDKDGRNEVIAGKGNEIMIFSDKGELLDNLTLEGDLSRWRSDSPSVDMADINNDGFQEIIAVTNKGNLYVFGLKK